MEVVVEPYDKITIRSYLRHSSPEAFVEAITLPLSREGGGRIAGMTWANGVLFRHFPYTPTDTITREYLRGHLPLDHLEFASMPVFRREIHSGGFIVTVLDVSDHLTLSRLAKWIASNLLDKKPKGKK
jgi:hypothetical protein